MTNTIVVINDKAEGTKGKIPPFANRKIKQIPFNVIIATPLIRPKRSGDDTNCKDRIPPTADQIKTQRTSLPKGKNHK